MDKHVMSPFESALEAELYGMAPIGHKLRPRVYYDDVAANSVKIIQSGEGDVMTLNDEGIELINGFVFRRRGIVGRFGIDYILYTDQPEIINNAAKRSKGIIDYGEYKEQLMVNVLNKKVELGPNIDYGMLLARNSDCLFHFIYGYDLVDAGVVDNPNHPNLNDSVNTLIGKIDGKTITPAELCKELINFLRN